MQQLARLPLKVPALPLSQLLKKKKKIALISVNAGTRASDTHQLSVTL